MHSSQVQTDVFHTDKRVRKKKFSDDYYVIYLKGLWNKIWKKITTN